MASGSLVVRRQQARCRVAQIDLTRHHFLMLTRPTLTVPQSNREYDMSEVNGAAIEQLAKKLAKQDGLEWDVEFKPTVRYSKTELRPLAKEEDRQKYLARAREQLMAGKQDA